MQYVYQPRLIFRVFLCLLLPLVGCTLRIEGNPGTGTSPSSASVWQWVGAKANLLTGWVSGSTPYWTWPSFEGTMYRPAALAVDPTNGYMYVAESWNARVQRLSLSTGEPDGAIGNMLSSYGTCPSEGVAAGWCTGGHAETARAPGAFDNPKAMAVDASNSFLYVADTANHRVSKYNASTGAHVGSIGAIGASYLNTSKLIPGPQTFSISAWFKTTTTRGGMIVGFLNRKKGSASSYDRHIYMSPNGTLRFGVYNGTTSVVASAGTFNDGNWHHVVGTFTANDLRLYVDGNLAGSLAGVTYAQHYTGYWRIGYGEAGWPSTPTSRYFEGSIDDVGVWNSVLTAGEVANLFASPSGLGASSPQWNNIAYAWTLDDTSGTSFADASGNGNTASANGYTQVGIPATHSSGVTLHGSTLVSGWQSTGEFAAGALDGMFNSPSGIAIDTANNLLYVADTTNHRIQRFNLTTGVFLGAVGSTSATTGTCPASGAAAGWCTGGTFAAGNGDGRLSSPLGLDLDIVGGFLYVADSGNHRIVKLNLTTGGFVGAIGRTSATSGTCPASGATPGWCTGGTFISGAADGMLNSPKSLILDLVGNSIFVVDAGNSRITKIQLSTGAFIGAIGRTTASTGTCPVSGAAPGWCTGGTFASGTTDGTFNAPWAVVASGGFLYITDTNNWRVQKVNSSTGAFVGVAGAYATSSTTQWTSYSDHFKSAQGTTDGEMNYPWGIASDKVNGFFYIVDYSSHRISKYNATTGAYVGSIGRTTASTGTCPSSGAAPGWCTGGTFASGASDGMFSWPYAVAVDPVNDALYVADPENKRISKHVLSTGAFVGAIGRTTANTGTCPASGVAPGWCTGGTFASGASDGMFNYPTAVEVDTVNNHVFVGDYSGQRVIKVNGATGAFIGAVGRTTASTGTCPASGVATSWCTGGTFTSGNGDGMFYGPYGLAIDLINGHLFTFDTNNYRIVKMSLSTGAFIGAIGSTSSSTGTCPSSGAATSWCTGGIFHYGFSDGAITYGGPSFAIDTAKDSFYFPNSGSNRLDKFRLSTGAYIGSMGNVVETTGTCALGPTPTWCTGGRFTYAYSEKGLDYPVAAAMGANGEIFLLECNSSRVIKITNH